MMGFVKHGLIIVVVISLLSMPLLSNNASAWLPSENTWISNSPGYANDNGNWENGTPLQDQTLWFIGTHNGNCTWNMQDKQMPWGKSISIFSQLRLINYTGTITVTSSIIVAGYGAIQPDPYDHTTYPGAMDWLTMSDGMSLLVVLFVAGALFILITYLVMKRRN